ARFRICRAGRPAVLADVLPMLERLDLRATTEAAYEATPIHRGETVWLHDFTVLSDIPDAFGDQTIRAALGEAFLAVWDGRMESDGFNRLALRSGLNWREIVLLRAYAKYMRQARFIFSQEAIESALSAHSVLARRLTQYFHALFDPASADPAAAESIKADILRDLDAVSSLDDDRILRAYLNLIDATLRTNFHQTDADGAAKEYISFKLNSQAINGLPAPRPWVETFVYSPRMEGIHLRGGRTARGGIRWSDRREDFRTEVLGLVKAQMVKNSVIVPVGSKGGFVVKRPPPAAAGPEAARAEGVECYKTLIRGLLDLTDNLDDEGRIAPPPFVVRRDGDDPYLVVAADKGTATFSDIANGVSLDYGFWLGDAFASGGSRGYDHKMMGITARGAWECVKRHFREIGHDIQRQDFTVVGVGDMSGDVFGNGMLLSKHIRLTAAFDHRHIFVDPNPDAAASWDERKRLFDLPRSSWADYDPAVLSPGGRIFDRAAKQLTLTPEIRAAFGLTAERLTPAELIRALLAADVDLLWLGGVGTYVKASDETDADTGDRANDAVRVDAAALRCKAVGEGANLGLTQRARIEAGARGVRLNTDAIDNSAGVATSDHEVNIKILVDDAVRRGELSGARRNRLLAELTDDVAARVLTDNYRQGQILTLLQTEEAAGLDAAARLMRRLETAGRLDRVIERLPDDKALAARGQTGRGLTRPELAVLLAYAKLELYDALLAAELPEEPFVEATLRGYFPEALRREAPEALRRHRLRREIVATRLSNELVNRIGPYFIGDVMESAGCGAADAVRAYVAARDIFDLPTLWREIEALDNRAPAAAQTAMLAETARLATR
ncbi:MAG TPA: NAD-glutamate dehydrogenase, partial [Azospirillaceae bacterium]|nr:NAD-glutamate dehydrogenase [Azospirillaceae bacterium]